MNIQEAQPDFDSYYGRPIIKAPIWEPAIPWYFFLGGIAGASAALGLAARAAGNEPLARNATFAGAAAVGVHRLEPFRRSFAQLVQFAELDRLGRARLRTGGL